MSVKMEIPDKIWVVNKVGNSLSYVTYYEDNAACRKRQETGRRWARGYVRDPNEITEGIFENKLIDGIRILNHKSRYTTKNVVWRLIDPRGFEFEVYSGNMSQILQNATIVNGEIKTKCIYGREGGHNIILPEGSEPYNEAMKYTKLLSSAKENKLRIGNVSPGDTVTLKDNRKMEYLGRLHPVFEASRNGTPGNIEDKSAYMEFTTSGIKYHFFRYKNAHNGNDMIEGIKNPSIIEHTAGKYVDGKEIINTHMSTGDNYISGCWRMRAVVSEYDDSYTIVAQPVMDMSKVSFNRYGGDYKLYAVNDRLVKRKSGQDHVCTYDYTIAAKSIIMHNRFNVSTPAAPGSYNYTPYNRQRLVENDANMVEVSSIVACQIICLKVDDIFIPVKEF